MNTIDRRRALAAHILARGKALAPDRFPKPSPDTVNAWALVLAEIAVPDQVWPEAITWWSLNTAGDRMVTPRDLKDAAYHVRDQWETDPDKRRILEDHRVARLRQREAAGELPAGTAPETPADTNVVQIEARRDETAGAWKRLRAGIEARATARRNAERSDRPQSPVEPTGGTPTGEPCESPADAPLDPVTGVSGSVRRVQDSHGDDRCEDPRRRPA